METLKHAPADLPERYRKLAEKALGSNKSALKAAVKLFCVQCMGWDAPAARACDAQGCPLWFQSRLAFGGIAREGAEILTQEARSASGSAGRRRHEISRL